MPKKACVYSIAVPSLMLFYADVSGLEDERGIRGRR